MSSPSLAQSTLKLVPQADLKNIDPIWTTAAITRNHGYMVYDVLFAPDSKFNYKPQMVDTYAVTPDGLSPMAVPGGPGITVVADSDEHGEDDQRHDE